MSFVHLHTHSEYSMLDGLGKVKKLVAEAKRLGQPALAITDHGVMHGVVEFTRAAKAQGIHPIVGLEAYQTPWQVSMDEKVRDNYHLLLLAKDQIGYQNLMALSSLSHTQGFYYKPRLDHSTLYQYRNGLIVTTGCLGAEVPELIKLNQIDTAYQQMSWYLDVFGRENFFVELQEHSIPELREVNKQLIAWAKHFDVRMIATNDVHYCKDGDGHPHETLLCVQTRSKLSDEKRMRMSDMGYFLKSREQMESTFLPFVDLPSDVFDNTLLIAEMCNVNVEDGKYHFPNLDVPMCYDSHDEWLHAEALYGLSKLYSDYGSAELDRLHHELNIIKQMGFSVYFLIVKDMCDYARTQGIIWNVRGSGAGSIVAYALGITSIDPIENKLVFERFLNPARVTMPDFDLDFPDDQREQMINYTINKYGEAQVAQIVTFGRMKSRAAIRDVGRAMDISSKEVDLIAKTMPSNPSNPCTIDQALDPESEFFSSDFSDMYQSDPQVKQLVDTAMQLEGVARHSGIHASAVVVTDKPVASYTPLMRGTASALTTSITQYEFPVLESLGLLKVDFLGLSTLSVIRETMRLVNERHGTNITLDSIPLSGPEAKPAFDLLGTGETCGLFQVESPGMRRVLTRMRPSTLEHITATVSLYRPGPMEYIEVFIDRMHKVEPTEYKHEKLIPILEDTFGIIVYQEQIIQVLADLGGYTPGEADLVRRAIGKKKADEIHKHRLTFIEGCLKKDIPEKTANAIYDDIEYFARYGFNKAHGADYAALTIKTAWLKALYPIEYMAALLLVERDKTEKVATYIEECNRLGIKVLPPDLNESGVDFQITSGTKPTIRYGLAAIKNVGQNAVLEILDERKNGNFVSVEDFILRTKPNKRVIESLIKVGALDSFGDRGEMLVNLESITERAKQLAVEKSSRHITFWQVTGHPKPVLEEIKPSAEDITLLVRLMWERELLGVFITGHPAQDIKRKVPFPVNRIGDIDAYMEDSSVEVIGTITRVKVVTTRRGRQMAFISVDDESGSGEFVVFSDQYDIARHLLKEGLNVYVQGTVEMREDKVQIIVNVISDEILIGITDIRKDDTQV